jgi:hypothetical protein
MLIQIHSKQYSVIVLLRFSVLSTLWTFLSVGNCFVPMPSQLTILWSMKHSVMLLSSSAFSLAIPCADSKTKGTFIKFQLLMYRVQVCNAHAHMSGSSSSAASLSIWSGSSLLSSAHHPSFPSLFTSLANLFISSLVKGCLWVSLSSFHRSHHFASVCHNHSFQGGLNFVVDISIRVSCLSLGRILRGLCASSQSGSLPSWIADSNSLHRYSCLVEKGSFIEAACHINLLIHMHIDSFPATVTCCRAWSIFFSGSFTSFPLHSSQY